jgi:cytochrome c
MGRLPQRARHPIAILLAAGALVASADAHAGDPGKGKAVFNQQCSICHTATRGGPTMIGPNLFGVVGRKAGSSPGYSYSPGVKAAGFAWTEDKLRAWVGGPSSVVPGNKMPFGGIKNPAQADDLVSYLATLK